jgi:hypothetical protein
MIILNNEEEKQEMKEFRCAQNISTVSSTL